MSGFWESSIGDITGKAEDAFTKTFVGGRIPDNTTAIAKIEAFTHKEYQGDKYLALDWVITEGTFKERKITQKIKVFGDSRITDAEKQAKARHRALNMLRYLYQLFGLKPTHSGAPTDNELMAFVGKSAGIRIQETQPNHEGNQYNWVSEVHPLQGFVPEVGVALIAVKRPADEAAKNKLFADELDDDIPF